MARLKNNRTFSYFDAFINLSEYSFDAADLLVKTLSKFNRDELESRIKEMHEIEHAADLAKHEIINRLAKEFLPPIEREDIVNLSEKIDDVTDFVEDVLLNINVFNVKYVPPEIMDFAKLILNCCQKIIEMMKEFENFRKSKELHSKIVEINNLEETADELYIRGLKRLYSDPSDPIKIIVWKDILDSLEKCCDACEEVANDVENIVMKNS